MEMRVKCENKVICGNYKCVYNHEGDCSRPAMALDANGLCVVYRPRSEWRKDKERETNT